MALFHTPFPSNKANSNHSVKVFLRKRPFIENDFIIGATDVLEANAEDNKVYISGTEGTFIYDGVFDENSTQEEVFNEVICPYLELLEDGQNVTAFAYGQTGSGKTFTMGTDPSNIKENQGLLFRSVERFFESKSLEADKYGLRLSFLEIYNENLFDLLDSGRRIEFKSTHSGGVEPVNLTVQAAYSKTDCFTILRRGTKKRKVSSTAANPFSSRSHAVISLAPFKLIDGAEWEVGGSLRMVDLAGAEGVGRNNMEGRGFNEGVRINKDLLAVGKVLAALSSKVESYVPFRESIVTRLLKDCLVGKNPCVMIACVNPSSTNLQITLNTLRYAEQARNIKPKPSLLSTVKRRGVKRMGDVSATPGAMKKFASRTNRTPAFNTTISTPGHKPPPSKPLLNRSFVTPSSENQPEPRNVGPRCSSAVDLTDVGGFLAPPPPPDFENLGSSPTLNFMPPPQTTSVIKRTRKDLRRELDESFMRTLELSKEFYGHSPDMKNSPRSFIKSIVNESLREHACQNSFYTNHSQGVEQKPGPLGDVSNIYGYPAFNTAGRPITSTVALSSTKSTRKSQRISAMGGNVRPRELDLDISCVAPIIPDKEESLEVDESTFAVPAECEVDVTLALKNDSPKRPTRRSAMIAREKNTSLLAPAKRGTYADCTLAQEKSFNLSMSLYDDLNVTTINKGQDAPRRSTRKASMVATERNTTILASKRDMNNTLNTTCLDSTIQKNTSTLNRTKTKKPKAKPNPNATSSILLEELVPSPHKLKEHREFVLKFLNSASLRDLQKLPTIGPKTALVLLTHRNLAGQFEIISDLRKVNGLPSSFYSKFVKANYLEDA